MTHDEFATWDAAYVLGALAPADRRAFEEHLRECARCSAAVAELAGMPGLLGRVSREQAFGLLGEGAADAGSLAGAGGVPGAGTWAGAGGIPDTRVDAGVGAGAGASASAGAADALVAAADAAAASPPPDLLPALLHRARRRRARTRWLTAGIAAAAAVLLVGVALALPALLPTSAPGPAVAMVQVEPSALTADLRLTAEPWGTRIDSTCRYATVSGGDRAQTWTYAMVVTDRSGRQTQVSTWTAQEGSTVAPIATTSLALSDIAAIDIRAAGDGTVLLRSTF